MEYIERKPFQGVLNIIRFNWHFFVLAILFVSFLSILNCYLPSSWKPLIYVIIPLTVFSVLLSLGASYYVYDYSDLYALKFLDKIINKDHKSIVNINAGFDETSAVLSKKFPDASLAVLDFYDPVLHTEVSIKRARSFYGAYPGTRVIKTDAVGLMDNSTDVILLIFAAHEIRDTKERTAFFRQLKNCIRPEGRIIVLEHRRDIFNFLAYNIGFFHFYSRKSWLNVFDEADLSLSEEIKFTPLISCFVLKRYGSAS